jgi:hypothetical protein
MVGGLGTWTFGTVLGGYVNFQYPGSVLTLQGLADPPKPGFSFLFPTSPREGGSK